jgi:gluconokinase
MRAGLPLDDARRAPWLARLNRVLRERVDTGIVLACSALKARYRAALAAGVGGVRFVALDVTEPVLRQRLAERLGHFAGPSLLTSQLVDLELTPNVTVVDGGGSPAEVAARVVDAIIHAADPCTE